jgi:predicted ribosome quality control (RQC) complex YloA/Tae2 family protein
MPINSTWISPASKAPKDWKDFTIDIRDKFEKKITQLEDIIDKLESSIGFLPEKASEFEKEVERLFEKFYWQEMVQRIFELPVPCGSSQSYNESITSTPVTSYSEADT